MKKTNNKGFSLVELIIVIAIMAVLVGVLAPAYMRYVENARKSRDISAMDSVLNTIEASLIDASVRSNANFQVTITVDGTYDASTVQSTFAQAPATDVTGAVFFGVTSPDSSATTDEIAALGNELYSVLGVYEVAGDWEYSASGTMTDCNPQTITAVVNGNNVVFTAATGVTGGASDAMEAYSADLSNRIN